MIIPSHRHVTYLLCRHIKKRGAMTREEISTFFIGKNFTQTHALEFIRKMAYNGVIQPVGTEYDITPKMRENLDLAHPEDAREEKEVVAHYFHKFKPILSKHLISMAPRRPDSEPLRDISFKNGGISMSPFRNNDK